MASTLPLRFEPYLTPAGALPPYLSGLLPEGRRLSALRAAVKTSADDELSLLLAVGADAVGDVQVVVAGRDPDEVPPRIVVKKWSDVSVAEVFAAETGAEPDRVALPGVQPKASARMISRHRCGNSGGSSFRMNRPLPWRTGREPVPQRVADAAGGP